jgi:beta-galactosidase
VNGEKKGELNRYYKNYTCDIDIPSDATLDILVENMGRINYGAAIIHNLKGIISPVTIAGNEITGNWDMYLFPMDHEPEVRHYRNEYKPDHPVIYNGSFVLSKTGDTFLDMSTWGKGIVFVNGHNLGRYWNAGPQQTLYLPGCWLKRGRNTVTVFEQLNGSRQKKLVGVKMPVLDQLGKQVP